MPSNAFTILSLESVDSTNRYLKSHVLALETNATDRKHLHAGTPIACTAKHQTAGYGQQGRGWVTNAQSAVASLAWPLPVKQPFLPASSLKIAMALHRALSSLVGNALFLKWPNDLYTLQGKAGGLLIEQITLPELRVLILGIGLNRSPVKLDSLDRKSAVDPAFLEWFDLDELLECWVDRLQSIDVSAPLDSSDMQYWQSHDWFSPQESVRLIEPNSDSKIQYLGVDSQGMAWVDEQGERRSLASGLSSLRKLGV